MICCISSSTPPPLLSLPLSLQLTSHTMAAYQARYDYSGTAPGMLSFRSGDKFTVKNRTNDDWWTVQDTKGEMGLVPVSYLEPLPVRLSFIFLLLQTFFIFVFFLMQVSAFPRLKKLPPSPLWNLHLFSCLHAHTHPFSCPEFLPLNF